MTHSEIIALYIQGVSNKELSKITGLHRGSIQRILKKANIPLHKNKTNVKLNHTFFSKYTADSCYWAGFILADGNLRKNRNTLSIKLAKKDTGHLDLFLKAISSIGYTKKEYKQCDAVYLNCDEYKRDLMTMYDIFPTKTYIADFSEKIPQKYYSHFIRGIFDGDGCITHTTTITINIIGTVQLVDRISSIFYDIGIRLQSKNKKPPIQKKSKNRIGAIHYYGKNAISILNYLYDDSTENNRLKRKYMLYVRYVVNK